MPSINVVLAAATVAMGLGTWSILTLLREAKHLQERLKNADRRYEQLYAAYIEACNSNPNRPRITTMTQTQTNPAITATWTPRATGMHCHDPKYGKIGLIT